MIEFAQRFDPHPFYTDPEAAKQSVFGGPVARGWCTASLMMRLYVDHDLSHVASLSSPGVDQLRWIKAVRPGDVLLLRVSVSETKRSRSKPDRGIVPSYMGMKATNLSGCREIA